MRSGWIGIMIALASMAPGRAPACQVATLASVPITMIGRTPLVTVQVDGHPARFILDTGAERSIVSEAGAQRLGLRRDRWVGTTMGGIGGVDTRPNALPRSLSLGGVALVRATLSHDTSLVVTPALRGLSVDVADGLLGRDYLSVFDLDLDMPARTLGLETVRDCSGRFLPWQMAYAAVPVTPMLGAAIVMPVLLNGVPLRAMLDSGAPSSLLAAPGMFRMRLDVAQVAGDPEEAVGGVGPRSVVMRRHRFVTLTVGGRYDPNPEIWVAPVHLYPIVDMLLGMDWLILRHVWISNATHQVLVQTDG